MLTAHLPLSTSVIQCYTKKSDFIEVILLLKKFNSLFIMTAEWSRQICE